MSQPLQVAPIPAAAQSRAQNLSLVIAGIALNLALGTLVHTLKLPVYVDAVGTILVTLLAGWVAGAVTGVSSFLIGGLLTNPVLPWFAGTQAAIAVFVHLAARQGWLKSWARVVVTGVLLGVVAGIVSAPVIVKLFGGITGSGASLVVAFLLASGKSVMKSVVLSGLAAEPLDKTLQCLLAVWVLRGLPQTLLARFRGGSLQENHFISPEA
jgi:energy-coupling factor transport system substrate-specific component